MSKSTPYHCPVCAKLPDCYNGMLVFEGQTVPSCTHNKGPGDKCHEAPVKMVPVKP